MLCIILQAVRSFCTAAVEDGNGRHVEISIEMQTLDRIQSCDTHRYLSLYMSLLNAGMFVLAKV